MNISLSTYNQFNPNSRFRSTDLCMNFTDEGNACGFSNSKAQRERFAEYYDFSITLSTKQDFESGYHYFGARFYDSEALTGSKNKVGAEVSTSTGTLSIIQNGSDGNAYTRSSIDAISGGYGNGSLENGAYTVNHGRRRSAKEEPGYALHGFGFSFDIIPHFVTQRTNLRIHPDGNKRGTLGCIGLNAELSVLVDFYDTLRNYINNYSTTYNHNGQSEKGLLLTVNINNNVNNNGNNPNNVNQNE